MFRFIKENKLFVFILSILIVLNVLFLFVFERVHIYGQSMEPNYHDGQWGISVKCKLATDSIERTDIVIVSNEHTNGEYWIKRVIGLPGETIEAKNDHVYINGKPLEEPYLDEFRGVTYDFEPITLEEDEYFVMGDNRIASSDSRSIGPIHKSDIVAKGIWVI